MKSFVGIAVLALSWPALGVPLGESYWSVDFGPSGLGWMVGPEGRIARLELRR